MSINVIVYLLEIRHGGSFFGGPSERVAVRWGAIPYELTRPGARSPQPATWATPLTSMFMHASFLHIFANMLFLTIFGPTVEDTMGRLRFPLFYVLGGLVALSARVLVDPSSTVPMLGASGAIAAVLGGYILLYPRARVLTLVFVVFFVTLVGVPAMALLGFWFVMQLCFEVAGVASPVAGGEGIAYLALACGFAFGLLAIRLFLRRDGTERPLAVY